MPTVSVFLYPDRVCIARPKVAGKVPRYASPLWLDIEDGKALLSEPMSLANLIRENLGDSARYDICLCLWPEAYSTVMFSYSKSGARDVNRLRRSELDTVFRGKVKEYYTTDIHLDGGRFSFHSKARSVINAIPKKALDLFRETFKAQKLNLRSVAPMDTVFSESVLGYCLLDKTETTAVLMLDDACTSYAFFQKNRLQFLRTEPAGLNTVLAAYRKTTEKDRSECRRLICESGLSGANAFFAAYPDLQDTFRDVVNRLANEMEKRLHNIKGDDEKIDRILLCGPYAKAEGLCELFKECLGVKCEAAETTVSEKKRSGIALREEDLGFFLPFAMANAPANDLLSEWRKNTVDRNVAVALSSALILLTAFIMSLQPRHIKDLEKEKAEAAALFERPEYIAVEKLMDERRETAHKKSELEAAIEALPHGATNAKGMIEDIYDFTGELGNINKISVNYNNQTVSLVMTIESYNDFVLWQAKMTEGGRFSFVYPPAFEGELNYYVVDAVVTANDFTVDMSEAAQSDTPAEEVGGEEAEA